MMIGRSMGGRIWGAGVIWGGGLGRPGVTERGMVGRSDSLLTGETGPLRGGWFGTMGSVWSIVNGVELLDECVVASLRTNMYALALQRVLVLFLDRNRDVGPAILPS